jgi:hypothetical protein
MKKILFLILTMLSCSASAAWTEVTTSDEGNITYIDFDTLKKDGSKRTVWRFTNYKVPTGNGKYFSVRTRDTFDCAQETITNLSTTYFTQRDFKGELLSVEPDGKFMHVAPSTIGAIVMRSVCSK